jgi:hypothetical protein
VTGALSVKVCEGKRTIDGLKVDFDSVRSVGYERVCGFDAFSRMVP